MAIFRFGEIFGQLRDDMAKARKTKADAAIVAAYVDRLLAAKTDRPVFEITLAELQGASMVSSSDLIAIAHAYNKGGRKPTSRAAAFAMIKKRFVEIVRTANKNKVAEKARPW
jgi:hypothetical protein